MSTWGPGLWERILVGVDWKSRRRWWRDSFVAINPLNFIQWAFPCIIHFWLLSLSWSFKINTETIYTPTTDQAKDIIAAKMHELSLVTSFRWQQSRCINSFPVVPQTRAVVSGCVWPSLTVFTIFLGEGVMRLLWQIAEASFLSYSSCDLRRSPGAATPCA